VLRIARTGAVKSRTAAFNQLKDLIITAPDSLRETLRDKTLQRVAVESARLRPDTSRLADPTQATKLALRTIAVRAAALNTEITALDTQLGELVTAAAPRTLDLLGVGPSMPRNWSSPQAATRTAAIRSVICRTLRGQSDPRQQRQDQPPPAQPRR
jgi:hypothetical protein